MLLSRQVNLLFQEIQFGMSEWIIFLNVFFFFSYVIEVSVSANKIDGVTNLAQSNYSSSLTGNSFYLKNI